MQLDDDKSFKELKNEAYTAIILQTSQSCVEALNGLAEVAYVEEKTTVQSFVTQKTGAPWGLQRISNDAGASGDAQGQDFTYSYEDESLGAGVDIYVVDTGVRTSHAVFTGRATEGFSFTTTAADGDGHGTHVAGTAAGAKFGVAQGANVIAVKVLGDDGSGSSSDTISGMDWVINNHNKRKSQSGFVGSIMSMSWGLQGTAQSVDDAIQGAVDVGIHVSVAAGNDGADACSTTPAHLGGSNSAVVTVGSVNIQNEVSSFSNIGECVDIYAPGEEILSSWNTGDNVINYLSGTSMATPHNSGVMAYLMAQDPTNLGQNPAALKKKLLETARQNDVTGSLGGSANLLLSNGVDGNVAVTKRLVKNYVVPEKGEKRTVTGSPASWAKNLVNNLGQRWELHAEDAALRF
ncbi:subtilisin-like protein [Trematosphaeria pertusa]|uniref:Subtilisin-like protein n=1 Tax=Trematosphaeria pertusa TaxID=390896 RepID=A0A6A6IR39_9PLEO|nr:subtilisin-like protein [Trematosphaeria pertusa]KAF2253015.1 subtilisin-like protein [Trematosphaeria pertusa]